MSALIPYTKAHGDVIIVGEGLENLGLCSAFSKVGSLSFNIVGVIEPDFPQGEISL
jgi:hypothetical protein